VTRSGFNLSNLSRKDAMTIAVDPKRIPIGSKVLLIFEDPRYKQYNGVYTARDVGGAIKGNKIDLFLGDHRSNKTAQVVWDFGRTKAKVIILRKK
jgi:3D (Asp-Asp-Asp) domain-containing protein